MEVQLPKTSTINDWASSYHVMCSCNRNIQVFYCNVEECKDHEQKFFCIDCIVLDRKHETHDRAQIKVELEKRTKEWKSLIESINSLKQIIDDNYYQHEPLIKYLDNENMLKTDLNVKNPQQNVDIDVQQFNIKAEEITKAMSEIDSMLLAKDLEKILSKIPELIQY